MIEPSPGAVELTSSGVAEPDLLSIFRLAGVLKAADVQVARTIGRLGGETRPSVQLAAALAVRAARLGSVCLVLADQHLLKPELPWPSVEQWRHDIISSPLTGIDGSGRRPLQWEHGLLYLDRYRQQEADLIDDLQRRWKLRPPAVPLDRAESSLNRLFGSESEEPDLQRLATATAATHLTMFLTGGPGTGKTVTIAKLLALLADLPGPPLRIALAAPTGKAAARLSEAIADELTKMPPADQERLYSLRDTVGGGLIATTIHRLLGVLPDNNSRFWHHRRRYLPYDVVVIDETSMVSLTLLARVVEAVSDETRLVLVGDPDQLSAVEAGAAFADLIDGARHSAHSAGVVRLIRNYRFGSGIAKLASAIRVGDAELALDLLASDADDISLTTEASTSHAAMQVYRAAAAGDTAEALRQLTQHQVLCAHRLGPYGIQEWNERIEKSLTAAGMPTPWDPWYAGRQLLVTENDYSLGLFNGDTGLIVSGEDGTPQAVFGGSANFHPSRLHSVETAYAMTVHRSQGSQFGQVTLILPPPESPLLTREMLYTAVTRARTGVEIVGTAQALRAAIAKPASRASGIGRRLATRQS